MKYCATGSGSPCTYGALALVELAVVVIYLGLLPGDLLLVGAVALVQAAMPFNILRVVFSACLLVEATLLCLLLVSGVVTEKTSGNA